MTRKIERVTLYLLAVPGAAAFIAQSVGVITTGEMFTGFLVGAVAAVTYEFGFKRKIHEKFLNQQFEAQSPDAGALSSTAALEKVREWSDNHYKISSFNIRFSKDEMHRTREYDLKGNSYLFYAFKTIYGEGNQAVIVFVEAKHEKGVTEHITPKYRPERHKDDDISSVEDLDEWKDPFWYSQEVRELRRKTRWKLEAEGTTNYSGQRNYSSGSKGGMVVDSDFSSFIKNKDSGGDE